MVRQHVLFASRRQGAGSIILVMQRLHEDDLSGHLIEKGGFDVIARSPPLPLRTRGGASQTGAHSNAKPVKPCTRSARAFIFWRKLKPAKEAASFNRNISRRRCPPMAISSNDRGYADARRCLL